MPKETSDDDVRSKEQADTPELEFVSMPEAPVGSLLVYEEASDCPLETCVTHPIVRKYRCYMCDKAFRYQASFRTHMQRTHSAETSFDCDNCGKSFHRPSLLEKHVRLHAGVKVLQCAHCEKVFTHRLSYEKHRQLNDVAHDDAASLPCGQCDETFRTRCLLKQHLHEHFVMPVLCVYCNKAFNERDALKRHVVVCDSADLATRAPRVRTGDLKVYKRTNRR